MIRTIDVSTYIQVQGLFVRALDNGDIVVSIGKREFVGRPFCLPSDNTSVIPSEA